MEAWIGGVGRTGQRGLGDERDESLTDSDGVGWDGVGRRRRGLGWRGLGWDGVGQRRRGLGWCGPATAWAGLGWHGSATAWTGTATAWAGR